MSPRTLIALEEMGNVTHTDRAAAYAEALQKRLNHLYDYQEIIQLPWYGRIWYFKPLQRLLGDLQKEQAFLNRCREMIIWHLVRDTTANRLCDNLEKLEAKLIKSLNLSNLLK